MCDFEEFPIISKYTRQQAVDDGILIELFRHGDHAVMATTHIYDEIGYYECCKVWKEFCVWKTYEEPKLKEEDRLFAMPINGKNVWVIEDNEAYTLMYPEDY